MLTTFAARPLTSNELRHALATRSGDPRLIKARVLPQLRLVQVCACLVVIEKGADNLKLVHETTMAYLGEKLSDRNLQSSFSSRDGHNQLLETT